MITIQTHHHEPASTDAQAFFDQQWALYSKIIDHDYLHHRQTAATLRRALQARPPGPLRIADLACGDARTSVSALRGLAVSDFHGVDQSLTALQHAANRLSTLPELSGTISLEQRDFADALQAAPPTTDVIWIGLSLHHLDTPAKLVLLRHAVAALADGGEMLLFEPTSPDGEDRNGYIERFKSRLDSHWIALSPDESQSVFEHVRDHDQVETVSNWLQLGRDAGFTHSNELFAAEDNLYRLFRYAR